MLTPIIKQAIQKEDIRNESIYNYHYYFNDFNEDLTKKVQKSHKTIQKTHKKRILS